MSYSSENDFYWASCQVSQADIDKGFEATSEALTWLGRGQSCGAQWLLAQALLHRLLGSQHAPLLADLRKELAALGLFPRYYIEGDEALRYHLGLMNITEHFPCRHLWSTGVSLERVRTLGHRLMVIASTLFLPSTTACFRAWTWAPLPERVAGQIGKRPLRIRMLAAIAWASTDWTKPERERVDGFWDHLSKLESASLWDQVKQGLSVEIAWDKTRWGAFLCLSLDLPLGAIRLPEPFYNDSLASIQNALVDHGNPGTQTHRSLPGTDRTGD